jgi:hypothetical protein
MFICLVQFLDLLREADQDALAATSQEYSVSVQPELERISNISPSEVSHGKCIAPDAILPQ